MGLNLLSSPSSECGLGRLPTNHLQSYYFLYERIIYSKTGKHKHTHRESNFDVVENCELIQTQYSVIISCHVDFSVFFALVILSPCFSLSLKWRLNKPSLYMGMNVKARHCISGINHGSAKIERKRKSTASSLKSIHS